MVTIQGMGIITFERCNNVDLSNLLWLNIAVVWAKNGRRRIHGSNRGAGNGAFLLRELNGQMVIRELLALENMF